jgi:hypothetical protein
MEITMIEIILAKLLLGLVLGYLIATLAESFIHHRVLHASVRTRAFWARHPFFGKYFLNAFYGHHTIHHARTYRQNFVTQFVSQEEEDRLYAAMPAHLRDMIKNDEYGRTIKGFGVVMFVMPIMPILPALYFICGPWITAGAMVPMFVIYPMMSKWIHRMIHQSDEGVWHKFSPLEIAIMKTRYMRKVILEHFLHHKYVLCNFNLLRGGDFLRRVHRNPSEKDLQELRSLGILPPNS